MIARRGVVRAVARGASHARAGQAGASGELLAAAAWLSVGVVVVVLLTVQPLLITAVIAPALLLARRRAEVVRWRRVAMTDALTGLWNLYGWQLHTAALCNEATVRRADAAGPAVVMFDVDRSRSSTTPTGIQLVMLCCGRSAWR